MDYGMDELRIEKEFEAGFQNGSRAKVLAIVQGKDFWKLTESGADYIYPFIEKAITLGWKDVAAAIVKYLGKGYFASEGYPLSRCYGYTHEDLAEFNDRIADMKD